MKKGMFLHPVTMKYIYTIVQLSILLFISVNSLAQVTNAKRIAPKEVTPITDGHIQYSAPTTDMGYIVATDLTTNTILWSKKIYSVKINPKMETDVQTVYIDSIYFKKGKLYIHNEARRVYSMNLETFEIRKTLRLLPFFLRP